MSKQINVALCVESEPQQELLINFIEKNSKFKITKITSNEKELIDYISNNKDVLNGIIVGLEGRNGLSLCANLREQGINTPVILLSNTILDASVAFDLEVTDVVSIPYTMPRIQSSLDKIVRSSHE